MSVRIRAAATSRGVTLPNGWAIEANDTLVVSDSVWAQIESDVVMRTNVVYLGVTSDAPDEAPSWRDIQRTTYAVMGGPSGGGGPAEGLDLDVVLTFSTASTEWVCTHNLGKRYVDVICVDGNGIETEGAVEYTDTSSLTVFWAFPMTGIARIST